MLKCIFVIIHVVIVVVWVGKEVIFTSKYKARGEVLKGKEDIVRLFCLEHFFGVVGDVFSLFVSQVCIHIFVAHNLDRKSTRLNSSHVSESRMPSSA